MATIAKLMVELGLDDNVFTRGLTNAKDKLDSLGRSSRQVGAGLTAGITLPFVGAGMAVVGWASDLDESINKTTVLFGENADAVLSWSKGSARAMGMSQQATLDYTSSFAGMFQNIAEGPDALMDMSMAMTQLTTDFGSFHNLNPEEAFTVISSALAGETEAIRRYGVDVSAAAVETKALEMGLADTTAELTEQDKALARYQIILDETSDEQGDFARTSNSTSNKLKIFRARLQDVGAAFGKMLLPAVNKGLDALEGLLGWLERLDPKTKGWMLAIAALSAAMGPLLIVIGMMLPGLGALLAVLGFLISPIGLIIAAAGILAYIFRDELVAGARAVIETLQSMWQIITMVIEGGQNMRSVMETMPAPLAQLAIFIGTVVREAMRLYDIFKKEGLQGVLDALPQSLAIISAAFGRLKEAIFDAIGTIDWGAFLARLGSLALALAAWLWAEASAVDWGGVIATAAALAGDITGTIVDKLGDLTAAIAGWLYDKASQVDWGGVIATSVAVGGDVTAAIVGALGDLGSALDTWIQEGVSGISWYAIGEKIGASVRMAVLMAPSAFIEAGKSLIGFFRDGVTDPTMWALVGLAIVGMILGLPFIIGAYIVNTMRGPAQQLIAGFIDGLNISWLGVTLWFVALGTRILGVIGDFSATLIVKGTELITGLLTGAKDYWTGTVQPWLHGRKDQAFASIGDLVGALVDRGTELITGFLSGSVDKWIEVYNWLKDRGPTSNTQVGSLLTTLLGKGKDLIAGLYAGAISKWSDVRSWLSGLGGKAASAIGSLGSKLYSAGYDLMMGLKDGILAGWELVKSILSSLNPADYKGPPARDRKMLIGNGLLIMDGLSEGLERGWQGVTSQLMGYAPTLAGAVDVGSSYDTNGTGNQSPQVIQIITLEPGKWQEFLANAEAGGTFARQFGAEMGMRGGRP